MRLALVVAAAVVAAAMSERRTAVPAGRRLVVLPGLSRAAEQQGASPTGVLGEVPPSAAVITALDEQSACVFDRLFGSCFAADSADVDAQIRADFCAPFASA